MSKQIFWDIVSLEDTVLKVNGVAMPSGLIAKALPSYDQSFEILQDTDGDVVLSVETTSPVELSLNGYSSVSVESEFIGHKPIKPK